MSWTRTSAPFAAFKEAADRDQNINPTAELALDVWEVSSGKMKLAVGILNSD
jgi:hypothetical protein